MYLTISFLGLGSTRIAEYIGFCLMTEVRGAFNKFPDFIVQAFKIVVDSWTFTMLLLYILWED